MQRKHKDIHGIGWIIIPPLHLVAFSLEYGGRFQGTPISTNGNNDSDILPIPSALLILGPFPFWANNTLALRAI